MWENFYQGVLNAFEAMSYWEVAAVILGIAYLLLAMRENSLCWYAAFGSTAIYSWLFFDVSLVMESALNVYYLLMAIYGWYAWRTAKQVNKESASNPIDELKTPAVIHIWTLSQHSFAIGGMILLSLVSGYLLSENTNAALPYLDSFTTWGAVLTTYMVAKKVLENWLYWIVIDAAAVYLFIDRGLYLTTLLMAIYVVLAVVGYISWKKRFAEQHQNFEQEQTA